MDAKNYDSVVSRRWQDDKALVHDVRTLRAQEVVAKHGYGLSSVIEMRRQLGVTKRQILRSRQFKNAVKTLPLAEVARLFRLGLSVVSKYRVHFGVARAKDNALRYNPKFLTAVHGDRPAQHIAEDWGCTAAYVQILRREAK
jgi:predicted nucleic acid-binding protein